MEICLTEISAVWAYNPKELNHAVQPTMARHRSAFRSQMQLRPCELAHEQYDPGDSELKMETPVYTPKHHDLIYDVGLHKGEDAEFYLRKGFRVVAFEADPDLIASCRERLKEFLDHGQLTIIEGAIVGLDLIRAGQKTVRFYKNCDRSIWGTVCADWVKRNARLGTSSSVTEVD